MDNLSTIEPHAKVKAIFADGSEKILLQLEQTAPDASELVKEHVVWAIKQQRQKLAAIAG